MQPQHHREVLHRLGGRGVGLVGLRDAGVFAAAQHGGGAVGAELALGLRGEVLVPGADRGRDLRLQLGLVDHRERAAGRDVHHYVQPGQRRIADHRAVVHRVAVEGGPQDLLGAQPDLGRVPVPGQVDQAGHVPAVGVGAEEKPTCLRSPRPSTASAIGVSCSALISKSSSRGYPSRISMSAFPSWLSSDTPAAASTASSLRRSTGMR